MTTGPQLFAHDIRNITVIGNIARKGFAALERVEGSRQSALAHRQRVIMPLDGFLRAFGTQEAVVRKLVADGKVTRQPNAPPEESRC